MIFFQIYAPVCVMGHFFQISMAGQLLLLHQAAFFPPAQLLENFRKNIVINKQRNGMLTYYLAQKSQLLVCSEIVEDLISGTTFG